MQKQTDAELIVAARTGDKLAFGQLAERYWAMARRVARQLIAEPQIAEELAQEAILQAYLSLAALRHPGQFAAWLRGIVRNLCQSHLRRQRGYAISVEQLLDQWSDEDLRLADPAFDPHHLWEQKELHAQVQVALGALSPKNRRAVELFYFEQRSIVEVAELLGVSSNVVKGRLYQARQQLKLQLTPLYDLTKTPTPSFAFNSQPRSQQRGIKMVKINKVHVIGDEATETCVLYLLDTDSARVLPIWIGPHEGWQIAAYLQGETPLRPLTFQFMATTLEKAGIALEEVRVEELKEITYYAVAKVRNGKHVYEIDARPSDAIGLALYLDSPILVADELITQVGQALPQPFDETQWVAAEQQRRNDSQRLTREWKQKLEEDPAFVAADAKAVLLQAFAIAQAMNHNYIGTEHLLLGLLADANQPVAQLLQHNGIDQAGVTAEFDRLIGRGAPPLAVEPVMVPRVAEVLFMAHTEASRRGQQPANAFHLLLGLLGEGRGMAIRILRTLGVDPAQLRKQTLAAIPG
jgi:RNA polymerase sigma factor (sigma-70 family)